MSWPTALGRRLRTLFRGNRLQDGLEEEMRLHLALRCEKLESDGVRSGEARVAATRRFGNALRLREESVDEWGWRWVEQFAQDVRFALRTLLKTPGFTVTVVMTLALAGGATTAIFGIVNGVLLRPLPFAEPDRLVQIYGRVWREDRGETTPDPLTGPVGVTELAEFEAQSTHFDGFVGYELATRHLDDPAGPERLTAISADRDFFAVLGVGPVHGRTFRPDDPLEVAVISERLWQRRFARDESLMGQTIPLDGRQFTVIGVMPHAFQFPYNAASLMDGALPESRTDVWIPAQLPGGIPRGLGRRGRVTARLKRGSSLDAATAELRLIAARVEGEEYRGTRVRVGVRVVPLADEVIEPVRQSLWTLFAAAGLALLAACANVANLLLARMTARTREVVIRAALGAGRLRLVRQLLAEGVLLSCTGGLIGLVIAWWGTDLLVALGSAKIPRAHEVSFDWQAFIFLLITALLTATLFSLAPAYHAVGDLHLTKEGGHTTMGGAYGRIRDSLVVTEVAFAFILALGAALVMREVIRLQNTHAGIETENVLTLHLTPRADAQDYYAIEQRVSQLPMVRAAGFTQLVPLQNWGWEADFSIRGRISQGRPVAGLRYVTPGYFQALGIPLVRGRPFTESDQPGAPRVVLVNEALARRYFAGEDPVDRDLDRGTIIGVVGDVRQTGLNRPAAPEVFYPAAQNVTMASDIGMSLIVRSEGPPEPLIGLVRAAVRDVNPLLAIFNVKTMEEVVSDSLWELNLYRWLIGLFAGLVLVLAAIGLYGVMSYNVTSRLREFGLRLALGSDQARLSRLVLGRGVRLTAIGLAIGIVASLQLAAAFGDMPMVGRPDALLFAAISGLLIVIALAACAVPAMRVAAVDPVTALRRD